MNKNARISIRVCFVLMMFSLFFALAENSSQNLSIEVTIDNILNDTFNDMENNSLETNETNYFLVKNSSLLVDNSENKTINKTINNTTIEELNQNNATTEIIIPQETITIDNLEDNVKDQDQHLIYNLNYQPIAYQSEQEENESYLYPDLIINMFNFINLKEGFIVLDELERTKKELEFITIFVIDTKRLNFTEGSFTKRTEGKMLYRCLSWNGIECEQWEFVKDLLEEEYTQELSSGIVIYGEFYQRPDPQLTLEISENVEVQNIINATQADGLIAYGQLNIATPRYRTWGSTNDFSAELTDALSLGVDGTDDITWVVTKSNHERDEVIMGTEDKSNDINIQIYTNGIGWHNLTEIATDLPNSGYRGFDIAYEDISGDALIVYEKDTTVDNNVYYKIWNGTDYSSEQTLTTSITASPVNWISLIPKRGADKIMLLVHNGEVDGSGDLYSVPWNGTAFDTSKSLVPSTDTVSSVEQHFAFAWEELSGQGLLAYGTGNNLVYRTYSPTAPYWSLEATIALGDPLDGTRMCSEPSSDYIGIIVEDNGVDVNARIWDGSQILGTPPLEDNKIEIHGTNNIDVDCAWFNSNTALFGFVDDKGQGLSYITFTKTNTWSGDLNGAPKTSNFASDDIDGLRFTKHPTTDEIMVTAMDIAEDISTIRWDGTTWQTIAASPLETDTEVLNAAQEGVMFDWFRYDPIPNVTILQPNGNNYTLGSTIELNVTVTDNIAVDNVIANITYPNTTVQQLTLTDPNSDQVYNYTFTNTNNAGTYEFRIIANDTSVHQNINASEISYFTIIDVIPPEVTALIPIYNSIYNVSKTIEISANVTDNVALSKVLANISYPNGTNVLLPLSNGTGYDNKFNNTFTTPVLLGTYNLTIIANDTSNNLNNTEKTNFTISDGVKPTITILSCIPNPANISQSVICNATLTDDVNIDTVKANVTLPNATVEIQSVNNISSVFNFTFSSTLLPSQYNVTWWANDTSNNFQTNTTNFTIYDVISPNVTALLPTTGANYNLSQEIEISTNVTDDVAVSFVYANITYPNTTIQQLTLTQVESTSKYNNSFTAPNIIGQYNITYFANDTSDNINSTETSTFIINDITSPNVTALIPIINTQYNINQEIEISANVTDDVAVSFVYVNITYPNTTIQQLTLTQVESTNKYNNSFTIPVTPVGVYNLSYFANDTSNNINFTEKSNFTVQDLINPRAEEPKPIADQIYNVSDEIEIAINATDLSGIYEVYANITYPNTTIQQLTLTQVESTNKYNNSFTAPNIIGQYNITYFVNDSNGNINSTEKSNFTVQDVTNPQVIFVTPLVGSTYAQDANIEIAVTVTDDVNVNFVYVNITLPNTSILNLTLPYLSGNNYGATFTNTSEAGTYIIEVIANDTSNNINNTSTRSFNIQDNTLPIVTLISPTDESVTTTNNVTFTCNASDNSGLMNITLYHNITGNFIANETNNSISGPSNETSFTLNNLPDGNYLWNCLVYDDSDNGAFGATNYSFMIDGTAPSVTNSIPSAGTIYNVTDEIEISTNVEDINGISEVYANITYPNTTIQQLTLTQIGSTSKYNNSFTAPNIIGQYNITYFANDSYGNINTTETTNFRVEDITNPSLIIGNCIPNPANISQSVICNATLNDDVNIDTVKANVTLPNATIEIQTIDNVSNVYNFTFTITDQIGTFNVNWWTNDTSNNINNTESTTFVINDVVNPNVTTLLPINNTSYNVSNILEISANVTDDVEVAYVYANITYPNTTIQQLTLTQVGSTSKYNNSFTAPNIIGQYNITYFANDTSNNINTTETSNFTIRDVTIPTITALIPIAGTNYSTGENIEISANVTDDVEVSSVYVNITYPNTTIQQLTLNQTGSTNRYNKSFTIPSTIVGTYTLTYFVNDTSNNINATETSNFITSDEVAPSIGELICTPQNINLSQQISCNATITDAFGVSLVTANITYPNGTSESQINSNISSMYNLTFSNSVIVGEHIVTWWTNDTSNNINISTTTFNVSDVTNPEITLNAPNNNLNTSDNTPNFNFTVTDNYDTSLNCSLIINGTTKSTNANVVNGTATILTSTTLGEGSYFWNISCTDNSSNNNVSLTRIITIDNTKPVFHTLITTPNTEADLDPNINVTVYANVTDNIAMGTVILQRKLSTNNTYTNLTLMLNGTSGLYYGTFNASENGIYNLRLFANDSASNSDISTFINISVEYDYSWTRIPETLTINANSSQNITLGNFTINNTGDYSLNFTFSSNYNTTIFNKTSGLIIQAKETKTIIINETAPTGGLKTVIITLNDNQSTPTSQTITGNIVVAEGQPVLVSTFTTPSLNTKTVTQGDTGVAFIAQLKNVGLGNASNITFFMNIPQEWMITFGQLNLTYNELDSGDQEENLIELTIPENATTGDFYVTINVTGYNSSGANLNDQKLTFSDEILVTVNALNAISAATSTTTTPSASPTSGGGSVGGTSGGGGLITSILSGEEIINSQERFDLVRGSTDSFVIIVKNIFTGTTLNEVYLNLEGFLSQYLKVKPTSLATIKDGETGNFTITITSPEYLELGEHELTAYISGTLEGKENFKTYTKDFMETKKITLVIHEISKETANESLQEAKTAIEEIKRFNLTTTKLEQTLNKGNNQLLINNYEQAQQLAQEIIKSKEIALETLKIIDNLKTKIELSKSFSSKFLGVGKDYPETNNLILLAKAALERENYPIALERIKEAELTLTIEGKEFSLLFFLIDYWWAIVLVLLCGGLLGLFGYKQYQKIHISNTIKNLEKEENTINKLMRETQLKYFKGKLLGSTTFKETMDHYEKRLSKVRKEIIRLRNKRIRLLHSDQLQSDLMQERKEVIDKMKTLQKGYFQSKKISKDTYQRESEVYQQRLAEIESEQLTIEMKIQNKQKPTPKLKKRQEPKDTVKNDKKELKKNKPKNKEQDHKQNNKLGKTKIKTKKIKKTINPNKNNKKNHNNNNNSSKEKVGEKLEKKNKVKKIKKLEKITSKKRSQPKQKNKPKK